MALAGLNAAKRIQICAAPREVNKRGEEQEVASLGMREATDVERPFGAAPALR